MCDHVCSLHVGIGVLLGRNQESEEQKGGDDRHGCLFRFPLREDWKSCDKCSLILRGKDRLFSVEAKGSGEKLAFVTAEVSV